MEYGDQWGDLYDRVHTLTGDISFWIEEAQASGGPVLELACGTGRVAIPIAQSGAPVVGLDLSRELLKIAQAKARRQKVSAHKIRLIQGDMRRFSLRQRFPLIIIPFRSFQALLSTADQFEALAAIHEHLAPAGQVIIDLFVPDLHRLLGEPGARTHERDRVDPVTGHTLVIGEQASYDNFNQIIHTRPVIEEWDRRGVLVRTVMKEYQLRYIHRFEMQHLLAAAGFEIAQVYGSFAREPLDESSTEMIWVARCSLQAS